MSEARPLRGCEGCGQVDDGPRHVISAEDGSAGVPSGDAIRKFVELGISDDALAAVLDPTTRVLHMDCCAAAGCPAEPGKRCGDSERAGSGKQNDALLAHITGGGS